VTEESLDQPSRRFWQWRRVPFPTWRGWLVILLVIGPLLVVGCRQLHPFLAVTDSKPGGLLVVEGWAPDPAYKAAIEEFRSHSYEAFCVTGGPLDSGAPLAEYGTYAERGAAIARAYGLSSNVVHAIPAPRVRADRTFTSALALKRWIEVQKRSVTKINLVTEGPHARRSRLLFSKALGNSVEVGIIALPVLDYDPARWWRSSAGVRGVVGELLGYGYVRLLFHGA